MFDWWVKKTGQLGARPAKPLSDAVADTGGDAAPRAVTVPAPLLDDGPAALRRSEMRRLHALDARGEAVYQYAAETAARICGTPVALVTLIDGDVPSIQAAIGIRPDQVPPDLPFCSVALLDTDAVMVIADATRDARFAYHPVVKTHPGVRFYAGAPLVSAQGVALGTVSVADFEPRDLSPVQVRTMQLLARQLAMVMEARAERGVAA